MAAYPSGWALRKNGTCELQEVDCGETVAPYRVCCPHASSCPHQYNANCCPTSANCTASLIVKPDCANQTWDLYDNDGYFCCLPGYLGYAAKNTGSNGCASPGYKLQFGEVLLRLIKAGVSSGSGDGASTITTSSVSSAPTETPPTREDSGLTTGAKVGIGIGAGVGGVALLVLAYFVLQRRRTGRGKQPQTPEPEQTPVAGAGQELPGEEVPKIQEMNGHGRYVLELGDGHHHELEGDNNYLAAEAQG